MANPRESKPVLHTKKHIARLERERQQTRLILFSFIGIVVIVIGLLVYGYLELKYFQARRAIAKVGDASLTIGEWQARVRMERSRLIRVELQYQQYAQYFGMDLSSQIMQIEAQLNSPTTLGQTVLNRMIDEELIRQEAAKRGITVSEADIDKAIQESYQYFPNGTPSPTITPTEITFPTLSPDTLAIVTITPTPTLQSTAQADFLTPTPTEIVTPTLTLTPTLDPLASPTATIPPTATATTGPTATITPTDTITPTASITPTATPYTLDAFQQNYKSGVDSLIQLGLTEAQIRQLYETNLLRTKLFDVITADTPRTQEQVWARHILVKDEATAKQVEDRLAKGEDFATVAKEMSTDTGSAVVGGDLGWFGKGAMVPEFETAAFSLKVGEISQPVQSQYGFHIIQVLAHENVPLDASAYEQARQAAFSDWLTKARDEYKVQTFDVWQTIVPTDPAIPSSSQ